MSFDGHRRKAEDLPTQLHSCHWNDSEERNGSIWTKASKTRLKKPRVAACEWKVMDVAGSGDGAG
jgi:hypothetical protein